MAVIPVTTKLTLAKEKRRSNLLVLNIIDTQLVSLDVCRISGSNETSTLIIQVYQGHFLLSKCKLCVYYLNKTSIFKIYLG